MTKLIETALSHARTFYMILALMFVSGIYSYTNIPKESDPDIPIPVVYVSLTLEGISPEDAINLLVKPMEKELKSLEGLDEMEAAAYQGGANITLHFFAGGDIDKALDDVRNKVDIAKAELPTDADEPTVTELNISTFPILRVILRGDVPEKQLKQLAENLEDSIEGISGVLKVEVGGTREEQIIIEADRAMLESYDIPPAQFGQIISNNNLLIAAGSLEVDHGRYAVKVPGLLETAEDILNLPVMVDGDKIVKIQDMAKVKLGFKEKLSISRINGSNAVTLDVSKRIGENVIETVDKVKALVEKESELWGEGVHYSFASDQSIGIRTMLRDLQNNVIFTVLLVMIVILAALGPRSATLVATAIPGSFFFAMTILFGMGLTTNVVVLFALILSVGMLVDGAIVVTELADKRMREGHSRHDAFSKAAQYMAWPIIASTATTLAAFMPLLFWPDIIGEFMKFMPLTLIFTLTGSLIMALIFLPLIGATIGERPTHFPPDIFAGVADQYSKALEWTLDRPGKIILACVGVFFASMVLYGVLGKGVEFFPEIEPEQAKIKVHTRGDFSVPEKDRLMRKLAERIGTVDGIEVLGVETVGSTVGTDLKDDVVGVINIQPYEWNVRRDISAYWIYDEVLRRVGDIPGVEMELEHQQGGPTQGKPIKIAIVGNTNESIFPVAEEIKKRLVAFEGAINVTDTLPAAGIEWVIDVDRAEAARQGSNIVDVGTTVRMVTTGAVVGSYRPSHLKEEVDIIVQLDKESRDFNTMDDITVATGNGRVPLSNFVERQAQPKVTTIDRLDQKNVVYVEADVAGGFLAAAIVDGMRKELEGTELPAGVDIVFKGDDEDQARSAEFLQKAFIVALFVMAIILVTQFNNFYQAFIILSAVVFSVAGVLLGHIILQKPFGIVMSGLGVIALAGIVVNNNIVLIDTYNKHRQTMPWREALVSTGRSRLRPVLLTAITTVIGLIPMGTKINVDLIARDLTYNAPSSQWWDQLANSIMFGLVFATLLTLVVTPCMIAWDEERKERKAARQGSKQGSKQGA